MIDAGKSREELLEEIVELRRQAEELKAADAECKRVEEELRRGRDFAETLVETAQAVVLVLDTEGRIVRFNPYMEEVSGYSLEEVRGKDWFATFLPKGNHRKIRRLFQSAIGDLQTRGNVNPIVTRDGRERQIEWYDKALKDAEGNVVGLLAVGQDITDRRQAEEALRESQEMLRLVLDTIPAYVFWKDRSSVYLGCNRNFSQAVGLGEPENVVGKTDHDIFPDKELADSYREWDRRVMEADKPVLHLVEEWYRTGSTEQRRAETNKVPLHDEAGNVVGVLGTYEDITDRKRAEEALRESQRLLERTFASLRDAVFIVGADTIEIVDCNPAASRLFGYSREEILGRTTAFLHVDDAWLEDFRKHLYPAVEEKGFLFLPEFRMRRKDGTIFFTEHTVMPLEDEQGKRVAWVSVVRDITERKQADEELHAYQERLRSLASELFAAEERERRRIAGGLHDHVTQDLIAVKTSSANCLRSKTDPARAECARRVQGLVAKSISELRALTFELSSPILYELGLLAALEEMVDEFQEKHGIQSEFEDDGKAKPLGPDRGALVFRAVRELLVNVVKHAQADRLTVSTITDDEGLKVVVEDNGVGFDTAGAASTMAESGGFGLFGIRERLEYVGGEFRLESEPGRGARATLVVPLQEEQRKADAERSR